MIQALNTALAGYSARSDEIARVASRVSQAHPGENVVSDVVNLMVNQRAAEANLAVARVADTLGASLIHIIA